MGIIKDKNGKNLTEAEEIKKRYTELYKNVAINLDPHILEWKSSGPQEALLQTKLVKVMEFQHSYFKS